jgi:hypothetical protein
MDFEAPLAHAFHWWEWIPYLIPVVVVLGVSIRAIVHQRREEREREVAAEND